MNLGINLGMGCAALMGRPPDPNSIIISGARVCKLWSETHPGVGTIGPVNPAISADLTTHTKSAVTSVTGDATAYTILSDDANSAHYISVTPPASLIAAPCSITFKIRAGVDILGLWPTLNAGVSGSYCYLDGTSSLGSGWTLVSTSTDGTWRTFTVRGPATNAANSIRLYLVKSAGANTYDGDGDETIDVKDVAIYQTRAASHNNLARNTDNTLVDATGGVQASAPIQPLILDQDGNFYTGSSGQIPVVAKEDGRVSFLDYTDANVVAVASGDDPAWWAMGIGKYSSLPVTLLYFYGAGNIRHTLWTNVAGNLYLTRHDGTNYHDVQLGTGAALASWSAWALQVRADRTISAWVAGVERTGTQNNLAAATMTGLRTGSATATTGVASSALLCLGTGDLGGYSAFQPALRAVCARYSPYVGDLNA